MRVLLALFALLAVTQAYRLRIYNGVPAVNTTTCTGTLLFDDFLAEGTNCVVPPAKGGITWGYAGSRLVPAGGTFAQTLASTADCNTLLVNNSVWAGTFGKAYYGTVSVTNYNGNCAVFTASAAFVAPALALLALLVAFL